LSISSNQRCQIYTTHGSTSKAEFGQKEVAMLFLVFLLLMLWFLGFITSYTLGGLLHVLLVMAIVLFLVHIIQGRSIGEA
jgi:hypothetical protein